MKAVLFDLDGVIVDNNEFHLDSWNKYSIRKWSRPISSQEFQEKISGRTNDIIIKYLVPDKEFSIKEIEAIGYEKEAFYREIYKPRIKLLPGLKEFLEDLKKHSISCAIASNAPIENIDFTLEETGLRKYFQAVTNAAMVNSGKPAPDLYLFAAYKLGWNANECLVFEDSPSGLLAAKNAEMKSVGVLTTHSKEELAYASLHIHDFTEISIEMLRNLF